MLYIEKKNNITRNETPTMTNTPMLCLCVWWWGWWGGWVILFTLTTKINYSINNIYTLSRFCSLEHFRKWRGLFMGFPRPMIGQFVYRAALHAWEYLPSCLYTDACLEIYALMPCYHSASTVRFCLVYKCRRHEDHRSSVLFTSLLSLFTPNYRLALTQRVYTCNSHEALHTGSRPKHLCRVR